PYAARPTSNAPAAISTTPTSGSPDAAANSPPSTPSSPPSPANPNRRPPQPSPDQPPPPVDRCYRSKPPAPTKPYFTMHGKRAAAAARRHDLPLQPRAKSPPRQLRATLRRNPRSHRQSYPRPPQRRRPDQ